MEETLLSYYPMIIAPPLDPACEAPEAIQVEASGLIKEVLDVGHKVHWTGFLEGQSFLLKLEEVVKEPLLDPRPFRLPKGGDAEFVVDLEDMLQVLPSSTAMKVCHQPHGIAEGGPWLTTLLRLGSFRCWWWWLTTGHQPGGQIALLTGRLCTCPILHASGVTGGSAATSLPSCARSSMVLWIGATLGSSLIHGGIRSGSPPHRLLWQLYHLLIWCGGWQRGGAIWGTDGAGSPGGGWWRGGTIWGAHGSGMGGVSICWAKPPGLCTICVPTILLAVPNLMDLLTPGRLVGAVGNHLDARASGGGSLQLEKSIGGRPGGGGMYPGIPGTVVVGAVMPPEEAVAPYPGDSSTTWLHDRGGAGE